MTRTWGTSARLGAFLIATAIAHGCGGGTSPMVDPDAGDSGPGSDAGDGSAPGPKTGDGGPDGAAGDAEAGAEGGVVLMGCGDGRLDEGEACDDGNTSNGDGCSSACEVETGFNCPVEGAKCEECGNGVKESTEDCDDGNKDNGDGCSSACELEGKFVCPVPGKGCNDCGNGTVEGLEICDDGNNEDGDGCSADCGLIDQGYNCDPEGGVCEQCGDGEVGFGEACDDGNRISLDGCLFNCTAVEDGFSCPEDGGQCKLCGNGRLEWDEQCDDGNTEPGDGCNASCAQETGFLCVVPGRACYECGNGVQEGSAETGEKCDDGSSCRDGKRCDVDGDCTDGSTCIARSGDGCSDTCQVETDSAWSCPVPGEPCVSCGNGTVEGTDDDLIREECDDGRRCADGTLCDSDAECASVEGDDQTCVARGGDGCSRFCQLEIGARCEGSDPQVCTKCGDGVVQSDLEDPYEPEACDDGNRFDRDGCSSKCKIEDGGWTCPAEGGQCNLCGNGIVEEGEGCDDGNTKTGDGCDADCAIEPDWDCQVLAGRLRSTCDTCGNGLRLLSEECDDGNDNPGDGCTACVLDEGWSCPDPGGIPCNNCGNGRTEGREVCDAGDANGTGCIDECLAVDDNFFCPRLGGACTQCGDGTVDEPNEACDDGNTVGNDGCSADCRTTEPGWICTEGSPTSCTLCGNKRLDIAAGEECDDGNTVAGDGCTSCEVDPNFNCFPSDSSNALSRSRCDECGNGARLGSEQCDDGDRDDSDGCSAQCTVEDGWTCPSTGGSCYNCGNGRLEFGEVCDEGGNSTAGCINNCTAIADHWSCPQTGQACEQCGDSDIGLGEACDDGGTVGGDGCSGNCRQIERGWICSGEPSSCTLCGNGTIDASANPPETCDDGNARSDDGCSASCQLEGGNFNCVTPGLLCEECGNGVLEANEACDDGNALGTGGTGDTDGCAANCQAVDDGWSCALPGFECSDCGDGVIQGTEQCDDQNDDATDGCAACQIQPGWSCDEDGCTSLGCGDGVVVGTEECDDGNTSGSDGCTARCRIEDGYSCPATGGTCRLNTCGDTIVGGDEQCDDGQDGDNADECTDGCLIPGVCGDGMVGADVDGNAEECDEGINDVAGCDACQWVDGYACDGDAGNYSCEPTTCGDGILGNLEECDDFNLADGDGCSSSCTIEKLYECTGDVGGTSSCDPLFKWVIVREFRLANIDPAAIHYDPATRSFVGYKQSSSQNIVELCLDGSIIEHPVRTSPGSVCLPGEACTDVTAENFEAQLGPFRTYPVDYSQVTGATYDPNTDAWFFLDSGYIQRVSSLPRASYDSNSWPPPAPDYPSIVNVDLSSLMVDAALSSATAIAVGDDARFYTTDQSGNVRAYAPDGSAIGFDFSAPTDTWALSREAGGNTGKVDSLFALAGFNAMATLTHADGNDSATDLTSIDTTVTSGDTTFGISGIPGALFEGVDDGGDFLAVDVYGNTYGSVGGLFDRIGDGAETSTDGSGFVVCTQSNSGSCFLFSQACDSNDDCFNGATCQTGDGIAVPYCATSADARADFANTTRYVDDTETGEVAINVLANDSRSAATCRDSSFNVTSATGGDLGGTTLISDDPAECGGQSSCVVYFPPDDGTCNIVDTFTYTAALGGTDAATASGSEEDTATVRVTVTCDCGDGELDRGEECDGTAGLDDPANQTCSSTCTLVAQCGNGYVEGSEACDDGNNVSGDGCTWDCQTEGCGNNVLDDGEECDDNNTVSGDGCSSSCRNEVCGNSVVDVGEQCDDGNDVETDGCLSTCVDGPVCGDGVKDGIEECDDGNDSNTDACLNDCSLPVCGDNITSAGEECDDGGNESGDGCRWDCVAEVCGDGKLDEGEQCDDANLTSGDGCNSDCEIEGCGNRVLEEGLGEECDQGSSGGNVCRPDCTLWECGDGRLDNEAYATDPEECDDGNNVDGDGCSASCELEAFCGDGNVDVDVDLNEECDYADTTVDPMGRTCNLRCLWEVCGNGLVEQGEECDDGANDDDTDGCRADCTIPGCGDGVTDSFLGETCDDGDRLDGDGCNSFCLIEPDCGNGRVDPGEECDDGGVCSDNPGMSCASDDACDGTCDAVGGDGCSATCLFEGCGNGTREGDEACDPAAPDAPDNCRNDCTLAVCGDGILDPGEECDDNTNGCTDSCLLTTVCGNGTREFSEQCDDGNELSGDGCSDRCAWEYCGNGVPDVDLAGNPVEECDDGNNTSGDGCSSVCTEEPVCGDGTQESPEQCDDGNTTSGDGCAADCRLEALCGDGKVDPGEECDPEDPETGDGCSQNCTIIVVVI